MIRSPRSWRPCAVGLCLAASFGACVDETIDSPVQPVTLGSAASWVLSETPQGFVADTAPAPGSRSFSVAPWRVLFDGAVTVELPTGSVTLTLEVDPTHPPRQFCPSTTGACEVQLPRDQGITEFWRPLHDGVMQGFIVDQAASSDLLQLPIQIDGAQVELIDAHNAVLHLPDGASLTYDHLQAWDNAKRPLDTWLEPTNTGLTIVVDTHDAQFPVTVDPSLRPLPFLGNKAEKQLGTTVMAGDWNDDGYGDALFGGTQTSGTFYWFQGNKTGLPMTYRGTMSVLPGELLLFDPDGDGDLDMLRSDAATTYTYVISGSKTTSIKTGEYGYKPAAGDMDGDGDDEFVLHYSNKYSSGIRIYSGGSVIGSKTSMRYTSKEVDVGVGMAMLDANGDGYQDLAIGQPMYSNGQVEEGRVSVVVGSGSVLSAYSNTVAKSASWSWESNVANAQVGRYLESAGDVDNDGYDDLLVGSPEHTNGQLEEGEVRLFLGGSPRTGATPARSRTARWASAVWAPTSTTTGTPSWCWARTTRATWSTRAPQKATCDHRPGATPTSPPAPSLSTPSAT